MEEKEKLYDAILTEGVRWLLVLQKNREFISGFGIKDVQLNNSTYGFLSIARIFSVYSGKFYIKTNLFKYLYLKYIKKFKFLKRPPKAEIEYIDKDLFIKELTEYFDKSPSIIEEIYTYYYGVKR